MWPALLVCVVHPYHHTKYRDLESLLFRMPYSCTVLWYMEWEVICNLARICMLRKPCWPRGALSRECGLVFCSCVCLLLVLQERTWPWEVQEHGMCCMLLCCWLGYLRPQLGKSRCTKLLIQFSDWSKYVHWWLSSIGFVFRMCAFLKTYILETGKSA